MKTIWKRKQRVVGVALALALLASLTLVNASGLAVTSQELLVNGDFEGGFTYVAGCGMVGKGWGCFTNGGTVAYGFYDDQWAPVVANGSHSQLIELNTMQYAASEADRYAGIYQTVKLVKGSNYQFKVQGLMREGLRPEHKVEPGDDSFRYRVQWGYTADGATDWAKVSNWVELPWDKIDGRTSPTGLQSFTTTFAAPSDKITLFVRVWKKWGTVYRELDVNLDAASLFGPSVKNGTATTGTTTTTTTGTTTTTTTTTTAAACNGKNYVANGDFEGGFVGGVGKGWTAFNNGGQAAYGFYDEMWGKVIKDGAHGQLIEINTLGLAASDPDRRAGIYQVVKGLKKGTTYELSLYGLMRANDSGEDPYRYRVEWGYAAADADPSQDDVKNWTELSWDDIYPRETPGAMAVFSARFQAPGNKIVLAIRAWKKWGTAQRELDVNLDAIKLVSCPPTGACTHVVAKGQTLSAIAVKYGTTVAVLAEMNKLVNPNVLLVGQKLVVPCKGTPPPPPPPSECTWYTVVRGDTLYKIALKYNTTVAALVERNKIPNPNLIYVGQQLCIVDP
jgi:LysM repeat protein